jgi:hypothetical protein
MYSVERFCLARKFTFPLEAVRSRVSSISNVACFEKVCRDLIPDNMMGGYFYLHRRNKNDIKAHASSGFPWDRCIIWIMCRKIDLDKYVLVTTESGKVLSLYFVPLCTLVGSEWSIGVPSTFSFIKYLRPTQVALACTCKQIACLKKLNLSACRLK